MTARTAVAGRHAKGVWLAAGVAVLATSLALWAKAWCGSPAMPSDLYLRWCYSDIPPLFFTEGLSDSAVPYLDSAVEYPVLTGLWMWLAGLVADTPFSFLLATGVLLLLSAAASAGLLAREVGWVRTLAFAAAPTLLVSGAVNWDLPAVALATAGLVAHRRARDGLAGTALGLGTAAKLFPALFLPPVVLAAWRLRGARAGLATALSAVAAWSAVNLPVLLVAPDNWLEFFRLSRTRPSDWDALTTVVADLAGWSLPVPSLNLVTAAVFAGLAAAILAVAVRRDGPASWHLASLPLLAAFLLANKVYSPQFSLWLLPLFALAFPGWGWVVAFAVADVAVTATRFPYLAGFVDGGLPGAWPWWPFAGALVARAAALGAAAWIGWRRSGARPSQGGHPTRAPRGVSRKDSRRWCQWHAGQTSTV